MRHTLCKAERISSKITIERLFSSGNKSMLAFPLRAVYVRQKRLPGEPPVAVMMSVSKRHFKHAVDRNRVKRQLREAYRLNKQILTSHFSGKPDESIQIAFIWLADNHEKSEVVHRKLVNLLNRIAEREFREPNTRADEIAE